MRCLGFSLRITRKKYQERNEQPRTTSAVRPEAHAHAVCLASQRVRQEAVKLLSVLKPDFLSQASPRSSGYDPSKRRDSAAQAEDLRARISGTSPNVTPSGTPSRRGSLGGAPVTAKLESLTQEVTDLKQERGTLRDLVTHLKAELKEKDRELETLKVDTHHSLAPWSSTRRAVRSFHVALYAVRALS